MPDQVNPANQTTSVNTNPQTKAPLNWKLIGIISIVAAIVIAGLGYGAVVLNLFGDKPSTETPDANKVATKSAEQNKTNTPSEKEERFVFYRQGASIPYSAVYSVKTDGTSEIKLAENVPPSGGGQCCDSKISRDSSLMAFTSNHKLWVVGLDGKGLKQLTTIGRDFTTQFLPIDVTIIDWSPDNTKILYYLRSVPNELGGLYPNTPAGAIEDPSVKYGIYLYDLTKGKESFVTNAVEPNGWDYVGWPKGTEKALFNIGRLNSPEFSEYLYALNLSDGSFNKFSNQKYPGLWIVGQSSISNDGKKFVWNGLGVARDVKNNQDFPPTSSEQIFVSNIDGSNRTQITETLYSNEYQSPRFLTNDLYISLSRTLLDANKAPIAYEVYLYNITTGKNEKKVNNAQRFFFLDHDTVIIWKNNDIYKVELSTSKETLLAKAAYFNLSFYH